MPANVYDVTAYGAVPDAGDCSGAFNAAFNALANNPEGGEIYIPPGNYLIQNQLFGATDKHFVVRGEGSGSQLVINGGMANGIVMQQVQPNNALEIRDVQINVTGATGLGNGSVLTVHGVLQGCAGLRIENVHIRLAPDSPCSNVVLVRNPSSGVVRDLNIDGYPDWGQSNTATGLYIDCDTQGANAIQLYNVNIFRTYTGIRCVGGQIHQYVMEGFQANDCTLVGVQFGLIMQGGWYQPPGNGWFGGHINAGQINIQVNTWSEFKIADTLLYLNSNNAAHGVPGPQGFIMVNGSDDVNIHNCTMRFVNEDTGAANTSGCWGVALINSTNVLIQGNFFDINEPAQSTAVYSVQGNHNVRMAFNTGRGLRSGGMLANNDGGTRSIGEDIQV